MRIAVPLAAILYLVLGIASSAEPPMQTVTFTAGDRIPASLTLYATNGDPHGRTTPIHNNYRPKISFGAGEIVCMFYLPEAIRSLAPGETSDVSMSCKESIAVGHGGERYVVLEGGKAVGSGYIQKQLSTPAPQGN